MALDSRTLAACNTVPEQSNDGGDANTMDGVPPPTTAQGGDAVEAPPPPVYKKGAWSKEEDDKLRRAVEEYGVRNWVTIEKFSGLARPAKNCRLRWLNYLRPNLKKYPFTAEEERLILHLHSKYGNSWSRIASKLPGRSDNEIKNFWHKRAKKCQKHHLPLYPPRKAAKQQQQTPSSNNNDGNIPPNDAYFSNYPQTLLSFSNPNNHLTDQTTSQMQNMLVSSPDMLHLPFWQSGETSSSNAFTTPQQQGHFSRPQLSPIIHSHSVANMQMPWASSPPVGSPTSPMKLKLSSSAPTLYSVQMGPQAADSSIASLSGFQLGSSPNVAQVKLPMPPLESCFQSNLSIPESTDPSRIVGSNFSNPNWDLPATQPVKDECDHAKREHPSIQLQTPTTLEMDSCVREAESDSHWEIIYELREALAKVRFLKRKLKQKRIAKRKNHTKLSTTAIKNRFLGNILGVDAPSKKSRAEHMLRRILRRKREYTSGMSRPGALQLKNAGQENRRCKLQKRKNPEDGEYTQQSIESKKAKCENSETKIASEAETPETKVSEESFKRNASMSFQEQSHSIDIFAHLDSQNPVTAPNSNSWDDKLCPFEGLFSESSTLLQDSILKGDLFGQSSEIEDPLSSRRQADAFGPVYSRSTTTIIEKPGDDGAQIDYHQPDRGGYFNDSFGQQFSNSMERKFTEDVLGDSNLLPHQLEVHNSSYLTGKQIMEQEFPGDEKFSIQTSSSGNSAETSRLCESTLLMHPHPSTNLIDSTYLVNFGHEYQRGEQHSLQTSVGGNYKGGLKTEMKTECIGRETWKQESKQEQSPMRSFLAQNIWPEGQMGSQDQTIEENRFHKVVDPNAMTHLSESKNWNDESGFRRTGEVHDHEQQHDHMNTMSEELASLLEFFPTTMQSLERYNYCNADPSSEASTEFEKGLGFHMPSASHPLIPTADYT